MAVTTIEELLDPGYVDGLAALTLPEVRGRRDAASEVETGLSYLRRMVQGRLDIVLAERQRRQAGRAPQDLAGLVHDLPEILGDHVHAPGLGRLPTIMAPGEVDTRLQERIESIVPTTALAALPDVDDDALGHMVGGLADLEREVSAQRRALHEVLDVLQEEIVRRYRSGEATVDNLLA